MLYSNKNINYPASSTLLYEKKAQATVEYVLLLAIGTIFALKVAGFFDGIFREGISQLESNIGNEVRSGSGFQR